MQFLQHHLLQILRRFEQQHLPLDLFLSQYLREHRAIGAHDRRFITETLYGMIRWRGLLNYLGGDSWEKMFALYKNLEPSRYLHDVKIPLHIRVSFPKPLFDLFCLTYGQDKAIELCQITNTQAPTTIRINPLKTTREKMLELWHKDYEISPCPDSPLGINFKKRVPFTQMKEFKEGLFEIQDEASQLVAACVKARSGESVLDYCAGSGGKSLAYAYLLQGKGQIYLHDIRKSALDQAKKRCARAGVQNVQFLYPEHPYLKKLKKKMDWVIADVPCSGTGTLRRNPDMKWRFSSDTFPGLISEQRVIFEKALSFVKKGGHIVYATCSILKEENQEQITHFLNTYPLTLCSDPFVSLPTVGGKDGFFAATFIRDL